jgi:hypothetical protein
VRSTKSGFFLERVPQDFFCVVRRRQCVSSEKADDKDETMHGVSVRLERAGCCRTEDPAGRIKVYHPACSSCLLHPLGAPAFGDWDHRREHGTEREIVTIELDGDGCM